LPYGRKEKQRDSKKALTQKIEKEELAWILLNFNQKRGYYQLREEETEKASSKTRQYFDRDCNRYY
jgi:CRISPR-associated endonuclease Csn1